jgi:TPR repeat protein
VVKALLIAITALAIACSSKSPHLPPDDEPVSDGGFDPIEQAGRLDHQCAGKDLEACRKLAVMYAEGTGVSPDPKRATALFSQACAGGNLPACNHLALAVAETQPVRAIEAYQKACDGGYKLACRNLGLMFRDGRGVAVDLPRAAALLDKACKGAVPLACTSAGDLDAIRASKGGAPRYREMVAHYKQGCDTGDPTACRQIGLAYLDGRGVTRSPSAAALWLERACMPDDPVGCRVLGAMKVQGTGVPREIERGRLLLVRACDAKDDEACRLLKSIDGYSPGDAGSAADGGATGTTPDAHGAYE